MVQKLEKEKLEIERDYDEKLRQIEMLWN